MVGGGGLGGSVAYDTGSASASTVDGQYRTDAATAFENVPDKALFAFYEPEHTMAWSEEYGTSKYYYTGVL